MAKNIVFFVDAEHTQKDRGVLTGVVHRSWLGGYLGHEVVVRGKFYSVPFWRFVDGR